MRKEITEAQITELMQAIPRAEELDMLRADNERLRAEMQSAKADAWDDGYEAHSQMIEGIARKPSNPYR